MTKKAVVLSSGGIDSTTAMAMAKDAGFEVYSLSFRYGQRHSVELDCSKKVAAHLGASDHKIIDIDLRQFGGSALTADIDVPKHERAEELDDTEVPITYVPARNTIFLSYAMAWAEVLKATAIYIGVTAVDFSGYPDCRPDFIQAFETMANLATVTGRTGEAPMEIHTPLIELSKGEIIRAGHDLGVDYGLTISCYDPDHRGRSCGGCDSCLHRIKGFEEAGIPDP
ncbi:MAG: 7-cyano-7-deazaguanine synthase QueC, partial [Desulfobacterales bacterium]|nr:7-cyano-7-deazaguanine synthase QueC [Desulfobacterales bacterium]